MAQGVFCTGAVAVFVGLGQSAGASIQRTPKLLGTGESPPEEELRILYSQIMNDLSGPLVPLDDIYAGKEALCALQFTRWDESVLARLEAAIDHGNATNEGVELATDRGTIMGVENAAFPLWLRHERRNVPAMIAQGMPPGHQYPYTRIAGVIRKPGNAKANSAYCVFHMRSLFQSRTGQFLLRSNDISAVNSLTLV